MVTYLVVGSDAVASEECDGFIERYASLSSDEVQSDEVDRTRWLDVDVGDKLVTVDNLRSVIRLITDNQEVVHTSSGLNVTQVRVDVVFEQCSCDFVVQFEQRGAGDLSDLSFDHEEEPSYVDAIECGTVSQCRLITPENGTLTLVGDDGVNSGGVKVISLELGGAVRQLSYVTNLTSGKTSGREPRFCTEGCVNNRSSNVTIQRNISVSLITVTVIHLLVTTVEDSVRGRCKCVSPVDDSLSRSLGVELVDDGRSGRRQEAHAVLTLLTDVDDVVCQ